MEFKEFIGAKSKPIEDHRASLSSETKLYNPTGGSVTSLSSSVSLKTSKEAEKEAVNKDDYQGERAVKQESENLAGSWNAYGVYIKLGSGWTGKFMNISKTKPDI